MPAGHAQGKKNCQRGGRGRRQRVMSFLQPCLLLLLAREQAHGYSLLDGLEEFGFDRGQLDPSLLYRALRDLESADWVESYWDDDSQGPRRRVYRLLPAGEDYLAQWVADLRQTRAEIDRLLKAYRQELEPQDDFSAAT